MASLTVASWNIFGGRDVPGVMKCLAELDADVIALQEVLQDEDGSNNHAQEIAAALGYEWFYEPTLLMTPSVSYVLKQLGIEENKWWGNALLSRLPMSGKKAYHLSEEHKRIALEATVMSNDTSVRVFSTHLVYGTGQAAETRATQVENLLALVPSTSALVMGDFNATPESETVQKMLQVMGSTERDFTRFTIGAHPELYHAPSGATDKQRLDYIFITRDVRTISSGVADSDASDHLPIYATVELL